MIIQDREQHALRISALPFSKLIEVDGQGDVHVGGFFDAVAYPETLIRVLLMDAGRYEAFAKYIVSVRAKAKEELARRERERASS